MWTIYMKYLLLSNKKISTCEYASQMLWNILICAGPYHKQEHLNTDNNNGILTWMSWDLCWKPSVGVKTWWVYMLHGSSMWIWKAEKCRDTKEMYRDTDYGGEGNLVNSESIHVYVSCSLNTQTQKGGKKASLLFCDRNKEQTK